MKIYRSEKACKLLLKTYDCLLEEWGVDLKQIDVETRYGSTRVIECGDRTANPLLLFHGVGDDSALMWIYNINVLAGHFHVFAIDTMGGPGKSRPNSSYNKGFDQVLWIDDILDSLNIKNGYMAGVSNGGYLVQRYTIERPDRVEKSICMSSSIFDEASENPMKMMMKVILPEALFPTKKNVVKLIKKLSGENSKVFIQNDLVMEHYKLLLKGFNNMAMRFHRIKTFSPDQIRILAGKTMFICGGMDPMGDTNKAIGKFEKYSVRYKIFENAGHGINHECAEEINDLIITYFNK